MQKLFADVRHGHMTGWLTCVLCVVLAAVLALTAIGCTSGNGDRETPATQEETTVAPATQEETTVAPAVKGEGNTVFTFVVTFADKTEKTYEIHTDKATVGDALLEVELIAGEAGQYGLYVKTVDGVTADYDKDGTYWAFYVNGAYAMTGVDQTDIVAGATYAFKVEK